MIFKLVFWSLVILLLENQVYLQEILSTNYTCAETFAELNCPKDFVIFVTRVEYKYTSGQCIDYDDIDVMTSLNTNENLDDCIGIDVQNDYYTSRCNGQQNCFVTIKKKSHLTGHSGTNCDFESNMANVYYACIPNSMREPYKNFDLCDQNGPDTILGVVNGFIHSPDFPDYYGNNHECYVNVGIPANQRLVIYLLKMNLEGYGMFKQPKDYLQIDSLSKLYGKSMLPHIVYNSSDRERVHIRFKSDWITTAKLDYPKGFLLFFSLYTINKPVVSTTTSTTTTTTTLIETTAYTTNSVKLDELELNQTLVELNQKREQLVNTLHEEERDKTAFIITTLVALIGLLIVIIFGLLFMYRKKPVSNDEDVTIYVDEKSINQTKQNESLDRGRTTFSSRLRHIYQNITQTLHNSNAVLSETKLKLNESHLDSEIPTKTFNVNEYQPDKCNDKDIPIVSLKTNKDNNIQLELDRRHENPYVSNPLNMSEINVKGVNTNNNSNDQNEYSTVEEVVYTSIPETESDDDVNDIYSVPTNIRISFDNKSKNINDTKLNETDA